jgi:hypothetical protein
VPDGSVSADGCKAATARVFRSGKVCTSCRESLLRPDCLRRRTRRPRRSQDDQVCPVQAGSPRPRTSAQSAGQYLIDALRGRIEAGPDRRPRWATPTDDQAGTGRHSAAPRNNSVPLRGCPLGRIQLDVTCPRANGAFRAPRSALSRRILTWLTLPQMRNARPGFRFLGSVRPPSASAPPRPCT